MTRDEKGRFKKGETGNPKGRPTRAAEQEYLDAVYSEIPVERFRRMIAKQAERAERGDIRALEFIVRVMGLEAARKLDITSGGEMLNTLVEIKPIDYRAAIAPLAP